MSDPKLTGSMNANGNGNANAESIAENIRAAILEHRLAPGAKLTEAQLCEVFEVKRGTVRQALAQLAGERLVDLEPNRGAFVASPSLQEVHEVFEMRRIIEMAVVEKICSGHGIAAPEDRSARRSDVNAAPSRAMIFRRGSVSRASFIPSLRRSPATRCCANVCRGWSRARR